MRPGRGPRSDPGYYCRMTQPRSNHPASAERAQAGGLGRRREESAGGGSRERSGKRGHEEDGGGAQAGRSRPVIEESRVEQRPERQRDQKPWDNTRLIAPFSGYISARNLYPGAAVNSQGAGTSTTSVGILVL